MTTATTVLGLLPMSLGLGDGAALRQPLAVTVIGGLLVSTLLTLIVIPCIYALFPGRSSNAASPDALQPPVSVPAPAPDT
jgi:HAE1 family hydrophobic/amphiphilic exporter-1